MRSSDERCFTGHCANSANSREGKRNRELLQFQHRRLEALEALEQKFHEIDRRIDGLDEKDPLYNKLLSIRADLAQTLRTAKRGR